MDHDMAKLRAIFDEVLHTSLESRAALIAERCGEDNALRHRVETLIAAAEADDNFLSEPTRTEPPINPASAFTPVPLSERPGTRIGPYKLLQVIGEGGFGVVFMAEQDQPVRRRVALKIIKLGMDTRQVVARFEQERQALALMDHPNIARVFDAGATDSGRPYFVMEYVLGDPITAFADAHKLSVRQRLDLLSQVCTAVQHAHTKGVIHRDIKPRNALVSMVDGKPFAKVIDFGIAKATGARLTDKTLFTEHRQLIGTPEYMSPEQAEGSPDIDTRTDVYALGVLLYELLTGVTPFDAKRLREAAYAEMQRIIKEEEPPAPSVRLSRSLNTLAVTAAARQAEPSKLGTLIKGELDWIVMKSLDKDRARRYETPNQLADDVQRHLSGEPVLAAPPSAAYRLRKFVRKHKSGVLAGSAVVSALILGITGTTWQWIAANRTNAQLQEIMQFGEDEFAKVFIAAKSPWKAGEIWIVFGPQDGVTGKVEIIPRRGTRDVDGNFTEADVRAFDPDGRETGGKLLFKAFSQEAQRLIVTAKYLQKSLEQRANELEAANAELREEVKRARLTEATMLLEKAKNLSGDIIYALNNDKPGAIAAVRTALMIRRSLLGNLHPDVEEAVEEHAIFSDDKAESLALWREALDIRRQRIGGDDAKTADYLQSIAYASWDFGDKSAAIQSLRDMVAVASSLSEPKFPVGVWRPTEFDEIMKAAKGCDWSSEFFAAYDDLPLCVRSEAINRLIAVARFRLGQFKEALLAASRLGGGNDSALPTNLDGGASSGRPHPVNLAIATMAQWQLDQPEEARTTLARLRELMNNPNSAETWAKDGDARSLLAEAEALIEPKADPPASP